MTQSGLRILICGDRRWDHYAIIAAKLIELGAPESIELIIHGDARGADRIGGSVAKQLGVPRDRIIPFPADWRTYGKAAGVIRNRQMLVEGKPNLVLAFHHDLNQSKGTRDMVLAARRAGIEVWIFGKDILTKTPLASETRLP